MGTEQMTAQDVFHQYKDDMLKLIAYLPWLEEKSGKTKVMNNYTGDGLTEKTISFPVFDSNLLRFVKEAESTSFIDRNYVYVISRNRLRTPQDEKDFIRRQSMLQIDSIAGILSKYIIEGRSKARMWSIAMDEGIFLEVVSKFKDLYGQGLNWEVQ